jgi:hypothetical protein
MERYADLTSAIDDRGRAVRRCSRPSSALSATTITLLTSRGTAEAIGRHALDDDQGRAEAAPSRGDCYSPATSSAAALNPKLAGGSIVVKALAPTQLMREY